MSTRVFIITLRRPRRRGDARTDPFWEFGSFGCSGCHSKNLLHPKNSKIQDGDRLAFVQGGSAGTRLLLVTPPIKRINHIVSERKVLIELRWDETQKPFRYKHGLPLFETLSPGQPGLFPKLAKSIASVKRTTIDAKFASRFRACTTPLECELSDEMLTVYERERRHAPAEHFISEYTDALPHFDSSAVIKDRRARYSELRGNITRQKDCCSKSKKHCH